MVAKPHAQPVKVKKLSPLPTETGLALNVAPVVVAGEKVKAERLPYRDAKSLDELRDRTRMTHVVRREGDAVLCISLDAEAPSLGGVPASIDLGKDLYVGATLVRNGLLSYVQGLKRTITHFRPLTFLSSDQKNDFVRAAIPQGLSDPGHLRVSEVFELDVRVLTPEDRPAFIGLTLNVHASRRILASCATLIDAGVDIQGQYVKKTAEVRNPTLAPKLETVGRVASIDGDTLVLVDHRDDVDTIAAADAYPQATPEFFERCLRTFFPRDFDTILLRIETARARLRYGPEALARLEKIRNHLAGQQLVLPQGSACEIHPFLVTDSEASPFRFPKRAMARSPVYVFDSANAAKTCEWPPDAGLNRWGPYSRRDFSPNRPRICVICQRSKKGQVEEFLVKLQDGMRHEGKGFEPFEKGFVTKYGLRDVDFEFFLAESSTADAYRRAAHAAIADAGPSGPKWNLCLVQIERAFRDLPAAHNPYMVCKSTFLTHQLPVQEFAIETTQLSPYNLCYALNNMTLALYAKMNGTPWLLQSSLPLLQEMVVGLGSARIGESRFGSGERVVGITTVFTGDGNYCLANLSGVSSYDTYQEELLNTLRVAIRQVRNDTQWRSDRPVRLVFHYGFKTPCDAEIEAVKNVMTELGEFDAEYAFVQLVEQHPYRLFDLTQEGKFDYATRKQKGVLGPTRGQYLLLSEREVLICLTGFKEIKRPEDGLPRPVLMKVHEDSTFTDAVYLARQVFAFSGHSWQGFFPCRMPVTVEYSAMIARLLGELATLPGWNSAALLGRIGWTRWFL